MGPFGMALSRRSFLGIMGKLAAGTAIGATVGSPLLSSSARAATETLPWISDWPALGLDPGEVAHAAYLGYAGTYDGKGCAYGVFNAIASKVNESGSVSYYLPEEVLTYGKGGMMGFGHICGTLNAGSAIINLVAGTTPIKDYLGDLGALVQELILWYAQEAHPLYEPPGSPAFSDAEIPAIVSGSGLCHVFVSKWCAETGYGVHDHERHECCARLAADVAKKTVELLNSYFTGGFTPEYAPASSVETCLSCHGEAGMDNANGKMDCLLCHKGHKWHGRRRR